ncbi:MAG: biotin--[acetyl-CoA-carboxylase] ligase [Gammaproteobacteria bacterium]|nr:biotin--[acetyl-CoA-carboxylase] ligase [Gammaproteobacteria bacterium]MBV1730888.1 biotin--[acetyl-CoA-carboxylase] ligase [Hydrogenophaga sp.]
MSDLLAHVESLWQAVVPDLPGFTVEVLPSIDSTNSELMRRARAGLMEPVLLAAEEQTAGRGRLGKGWHSKAGQSLTFSLALPLAPADWSGLSLAVGVSLAESLHPDVQLKWPNDLWLHQRKLGGILVETASNGLLAGDATAHQRLVVVGVGINIARPETAAVSALDSPDAVLPAMAPAGLSEVLVGLTAGEVLERVVPTLVRDLLAFESQSFAAFAERFARRDALQGRSVRLSDGTLGTACGVDPQGALLVQTAQGMQAVTSSEVGVRPC